MGISFLGFGDETAPAQQTIAKKGGTIEFAHPYSLHAVQFLAYLTSWSDTFVNGYAKEELAGRPEQAAMAGTINRQISFSFKLLAESEKEAVTNLERLNMLTKMVYPKYSSTGISAKLSYIDIRFANIIRDEEERSPGYAGQTGSTKPLKGGLRGVVENLTYTFDGDPMGFHAVERFKHKPEGEAYVNNILKTNEVSSKGIKAAGITDIDDAGGFLPKALTVSVTFYVLNNRTLGWEDDGTWGGDWSYPYGLMGHSAVDFVHSSTPVQTSGDTDDDTTVDLPDDKNSASELSEEERNKINGQTQNMVSGISALQDVMEQRAILNRADAGTATDEDYAALLGIE